MRISACSTGVRLLDAEASFNAYSIRLGDGVSPGIMSNFDFMVVETVDLKLAASL